jgi:hypothetical protein
MNTLKKAILFTFLFFTSYSSFGQLTEAEIAFTKELADGHKEWTIEFFNKYYSNDTTLNQLAETILTLSLAAEAKGQDVRVVEDKYQSQYSVMIQKTFTMDMPVDGAVMQYFNNLYQEIDQESKNWTINDKPLLTLLYKKYGYAFITDRDEKIIKGHIILIFSKD